MNWHRLDPRCSNDESKAAEKKSGIKAKIKSLFAALNDYNLNPLQTFSDRDEAIEEFQKS